MAVKKPLVLVCRVQQRLLGDVEVAQSADVARVGSANLIQQVTALAKQRVCLFSNVFEFFIAE